MSKQKETEQPEEETIQQPEEPVAEQLSEETPEQALKAAEDRYLRLAAEYDNFRKRSARERDAIFADVRADTVLKFLPVYDNLVRAIAAMAEEQQAFVNSCRKRGQQLMDKAQTEYDAKLKQAGIDAQRTVQDAKEEAESILASAKHTSQNILDAAKQKSEAIDQRGTQIVEQAKQTAANMIADAQKQQDDIRHECAQQVADAQQETEHYQQLRDHILGELNDIATRLNQLPRTAAHPNKQ